jgi:hypothetical protein
MEFSPPVGRDLAIDVHGKAEFRLNISMQVAYKMNTQMRQHAEIHDHTNESG